MGFESFTVVLAPCESSPLRQGQDGESVARLVAEIKRHWPSLCDDEEERKIALCPQPGDVFLFSQTEAGLYQVLLEAQDGGTAISLRFALCNPRTIHEPFCATVSWLMRRYHLRCHGLIYVPPSDDGVDFCDPEIVTETLAPHIDENRRLWQQDAGTEEEHVWRPGDALAWFVEHRCEPTEKMT